MPTIIWDITPYSPLKVNQRFGGTHRLHLQSPRYMPSKKPAWKKVANRASCSAYSSTLKMEAMCSSETSADFQRTTRRYIPEDSTLYNHHCENLKSYTVFLHRQVTHRYVRRFGKVGAACHLLSRWFLARLIPRPWRWRRYFPPKRRLTYNGLHGVISLKIALFITTAVITYNPTKSSLLVVWCTYNYIRSFRKTETPFHGIIHFLKR
jgi:hypothetical protein